jgi:hypothetical protein
MSRRLETGTPGGSGMPAGQRDNASMIRHRLADRIEDNLASMLERTAALLREHRRDVLVLSHALETFKTLTGDDIDAVLNGRNGPTVDGRPYADPVFYKQIEAYHRAAVVAHQNHTGIMLSLPGLPEGGDGGSGWAAPRQDADGASGVPDRTGAGTWPVSAQEPDGGPGA